jgi:D-alanine-D-alanine ligase-like ATP-grasp enzyme
MGLWLAGIDLRRTPSGEIYCLEINPSPGFTYYEQLAGVSLAPSIAALLL